MLRVLALLALTALLAGCGSQANPQASRRHVIERAEIAILGEYCMHGSKSEAQYKGCLHHVNPKWVMQAETPAARWARGERHTCGPTSGPRCSHREWMRLLRIAERGGRPQVP